MWIGEIKVDKKNLYMRQTVNVVVAGQESEPEIVGGRARQGCSLSPVLFSINVDAMMKETLKYLEERITVGEG